MADIEAKLGMSLDDLAKKEKHKQHNRQHYGGGHRGGRGGAGGQEQAGQQHPRQLQQAGQQRPYRGQGQGMQFNGDHKHQAWGQHPQQWGRGQQQQQYQQQQYQQQWGGPQQRQQADPNRQSVFARLGGAGDEPQHPGPIRHQHSPASRRPQQQKQQQQSAPQPPKPKVQCRLDTETGLVVITHNGADIIKVGPGGDVTLDSGGNHSAGMLSAFNAALAPLQMSVKSVGPDPATAQWSVSDGKGLVRFSDGMKLPAKGALTAARAMVLMQAFAAGSSKAAAAAQQASMQAAIAAGILPGGAAAAASGVGGPQRGPESVDAAQIRRLKAQGRYHPY